MATAKTDTPEEPDYLSRAAGTFATLGGASADFAREQVMNRVAVPLFKPVPADSPPDTPREAHPLRAGLKNTHASAPVEPVEQLPDPFPPDDYDGPLVTAQDYLTLIDDTVKAKKAAAKASQKDGDGGAT